MKSRSFIRFGVRALALAAVALAGLLYAAPLGAQQGAIAGTVTSELGDPLAGAQVFIPGTGLGAITDAEGRYRLEDVPAGDVELRVELIGHRPTSREVSVESGQVTTANFELVVTPVTMDELVATITGTEVRRSLGYSTADIQVETEVAKARPTSLTTLIQGRAPGVVIRRSSGSVGTGNEIKVRGPGSISLSSVPLIVVDGAIINNENESFNFFTGGQRTSRLNDLNPDDIESIQILKGAAASALWGSASNAGVVMITTKRGKAGETRYTFRGEAGGNWDGTEFPENVFNPLAFGFATDTLYRMNLLEGVGVRGGGVDNPGEDPFRTGALQSYGGSIRGGIQNVTYFLSGEYDREAGNLPNNRFRRWNVRANASIQPSDKIDISFSNGFTSSFTKLPDNDNNAVGFIGVAMIGFPWQLPIERADPNTGGEVITTCPLAFEIARDFGVPLAAVTNDDNCGERRNPFFTQRTFDDVRTVDNKQDVERYIGSANLTYRPLDFWSVNATVGYDELSDRTLRFFPVNLEEMPFQAASLGDISRNFQTDRNLTLTGSTTLDANITEDFSSSFTGGVQFFKEIIEGTQAFGQVLPGPSPTVGNAVNNQGDDFFFENRTIGWFFQNTFGWKNRLFVVPSVRIDDSGAFPEGTDVQAFPKVSASYVISDEAWFPGVFESFKLRASWGQSGKLFNPNDPKFLLDVTKVTLRDANVLGFAPFRPGNPELSPEESTEVEVGFEASAFRGRLGLDLTYFHTEIADQVIARPLPPSTGFIGNEFVNLGEVRNRGVEASVDIGALDRRNFRWDWRVNLATLSTEITRLGLEEPIIFGLGGSSQRHAEGFPFASYFQPRVVLDENGDPKVLTCEEDPSDGCDPVDDSRFNGNPTPDFDGSVSTTITLFEHVTLYGLVDFQLGQQLLNNTDEFRCGFLGGGENGGVCPEIFEKGPDGEFTDDAKIKQFAADLGTEAPWVEDADFARLRSVSLTFDLPRSLLRPWGANAVSLTLTGENLVRFTDYEGLDPEINFGGTTEATRADFLTLPPARRVLATLSVTF